jgi:putative DNA primase/helicase
MPDDAPPVPPLEPPPEPPPTPPQQPMPEEADAATLLVNAILLAGGGAFYDRQERCLVAVPTPAGIETLPIRSQRLRHHLVALGHDLYERAPRPADVRRVLELLGAIAVRAVAVEMHNRFAFLDDAIWIDLADGSGRAIRVDDAGWRVVEQPPISFRHHGHQRPLPLPAAGGSLSLLTDLLNLGSDDDRLLVLAWLTWAMFADAVHPVLLLVGPPGSTKTTAAMILRRAVDPSILDAIEAPRQRAELAQVLDQNAIVPLDNISRLDQRETDLLCKAASGGVFSKRKLRTDDDSVFLRLKRAVIMTAIPIPSKAADFLDRCLRIEVRPPRSRRLEREIWATFEHSAPQILGTLLDLAAGAMRELPEVGVPREFRLVDFAQWGEAVAITLGHAPGRFVEAYRRNMASVADDAVLADPVTNAIRKLVSRDDWTGTCLQLLGVLAVHADPHDRRDWPSSEVALGMRVSTMGPALARIGIEVRRDRGRWPMRERMVSIRRISPDHRDACEEAVQGVQGVQRRGNGGNGKQPGVGRDAAGVRGLLPPGPRGEA